MEGLTLESASESAGGLIEPPPCVGPTPRVSDSSVGEGKTENLHF